MERRAARRGRAQRPAGRGRGDHRCGGLHHVRRRRGRTADIRADRSADGRLPRRICACSAACPSDAVSGCWPGIESKRLPIGHGPDAAYNPHPGIRLRHRATTAAEVHRMDTIPDHDPQETQEWLAALEGVLAAEGPDRAHFLIEALIDKARRSGAYLPFSANTAYINTIPVEKQVRLPGDFNIEQKIRHYVRWNAMAMVAAREQGHQRRRPHRELRVGGDALRHRLQPLLARAVRRARRRPRVRPGPLGARRLRARVHARPLHPRADGQLPPGSRRQGHLVVPAPVADARLLAVPDGVDGPRAADGDLPGAVHEIPAGPRPREDRRPQGLGVHAATARWTSPSRWARSAWRRARTSTTWSSSSTATCSASTVRCAATARSSRSSRATSAAPAGT